MSHVLEMRGWEGEKGHVLRPGFQGYFRHTHVHTHVHTHTRTHTHIHTHIYVAAAYDRVKNNRRDRRE